MLELVAPSRFRAVVVIPVFNHSTPAGVAVQSVRDIGLRCILVDDGSDSCDATALDELGALHASGITLVRLPRNMGKGGAVMSGLREAARQGYSHAVQIDADGQHDTLDIGRFIARARRQPDAVICGSPIYDETVPRARLLGRYLTRAWVWINTLSFDIRDSMCGLRVYPLSTVMPLIESVSMGTRMDFDTEVLVRLHWRGTPIVSLPTRVVYPPGGTSHFHMVHDNWLIARMHARLFFGMLRRLPALLRRKLPRIGTGHTSRRPS